MFLKISYLLNIIIILYNDLNLNSAKSEYLQVIRSEWPKPRMGVVCTLWHLQTYQCFYWPSISI